MESKERNISTGKSSRHYSRRSFLRTIGVSVPLLSLVGEGEDLIAQQQGISPPGMTAINSRRSI